MQALYQSPRPKAERVGQGPFDPWGKPAPTSRQHLLALNWRFLEFATVRWRREGNRNPTFSGLWITLAAVRPSLRCCVVAGDPGMVQLLSLRDRQAHVLRPRQSRLADHLPMGQAPSSQQDAALGGQSLLRCRSGERLGPVRRPVPASAPQRNQSVPLREGQGQSQSLRSEPARLLGGSPASAIGAGCTDTGGQPPERLASRRVGPFEWGPRASLRGGLCGGPLGLAVRLHGA